MAAVDNRPLVDDVEAQSKGEFGKHMSMEWNQLTFKIGNKVILNKITGLVEPGKLTCVLGPSGSGKSTLMNVLAGRQNTNGPQMESSGKVTACGAQIDPVSFRGNVAYVMQDDALLGTETPRECLTFSSRMRQQNSMSTVDRENFVQEVLRTLHLGKCQDTYIGNALVKGVSGGERKRTSVGVELISNPKLLFLDEPLSGLDSYAAYTLVQALKELSAAGVPVLCTVHQPSSEIFDLFDDIIMLHGGDVVYQGPVSELPGYFDELGFPCKANFNPADHVMFLVQKESEQTIQRIKDAWPQSHLFRSMQEKVDQIQAVDVPNQPVALLPPSSQKGIGFFGQLGALLRREVRATLRNKGLLGARYGMTIFLAGMYAWLFAGSARTGDDTSEIGNCLGNSTSSQFDATQCGGYFQGHLGTLLSLSIATMMGAAQPVLLTFPQERPVFLREYAAGQYGVVAYFVSKTIIELPVILLSSALQFLVCYWIMGLKGEFFALVLVAWLLAITSAGLALVVGCGVASVEKGMQLAPLVLLPQMLFSGLFVPVNSIPVSLRWVQYICPLKYAVNLMGTIEFWYVKEKLDGECLTFQCPGISAEDCSKFHCPGFWQRKALLEGQSIKFDDWERNLLVLVILYFVFRFLSCTLLWRKGKYVF